MYDWMDIMKGVQNMNTLDLAKEIIDGRRITREDDLSFFLNCDL